MPLDSQSERTDFFFFSDNREKAAFALDSLPILQALTAMTWTASALGLFALLCFARS